MKFFLVDKRKECWRYIYSRIAAKLLKDTVDEFQELVLSKHFLFGIKNTRLIVDWNCCRKLFAVQDYQISRRKRSGFKRQNFKKKRMSLRTTLRGIKEKETEKFQGLFYDLPNSVYFRRKPHWKVGQEGAFDVGEFTRNLKKEDKIIHNNELFLCSIVWFRRRLLKIY